MKFRTARLIAPVAALSVLASCMHLPPIDVGDPLALDGARIGMVSLNHMSFDDEPAPADLSPTSLFLDPMFTGPVIYTAMSGVIAGVADHNEIFRGSLPPQMPAPPLPPMGLDPDLLSLVLAGYMGSSDRDLPGGMTAEQLQDTRAAAAKQLRERQKQILEEHAEARRQKQEEERAKAEENLRRLFEESLRRRAADRTVELNLPMPFYVEAGSLSNDLPEAARYLANGFKQDLSIAELELIIPDDFADRDFPDQLHVHGLSVTLVAAQRDPGNNRVSPLFNFDRTIVHDQDTALLFEHVADGVYRPASDERVLELRLNQAYSRALFNAINGGYDIYGNADFALSLAPALAPQVAVNFTLRAGHAFIRP